MKGSAFAKNLKRLRHERGWTQQQLSAISEIPIGTIRRYEQGRNGHDPSFYNVMVLADVFDIGPYQLYFEGAEEMATIYMQELGSELFKLDPSQIKEIRQTEAKGISVPKLALSDTLIDAVKREWDKKLNLSSNEKGYYRSYVEQVITRYAQDRQGWKKKFGL